MSDKVKALGIDLTSVGGVTPLPEDKSHPIFDFDEPSSVPPVDIPHEMLVLMFYQLQARVEMLEAWRQRLTVLPMRVASGESANG